MAGRPLAWTDNFCRKWFLENADASFVHLRRKEKPLLLVFGEDPALTSTADDIAQFEAAFPWKICYGGCFALIAAGRDAFDEALVRYAEAWP